MVTVMNPTSASRASKQLERGATIVEMIVATMLLAIAVLAAATAMGAATKTAAVAEHRSVAARLATSEVESIRSRPYGLIGIDPATRGYKPRFEGRPTVSGRDHVLKPTGTVSVGGVDYRIERHVTWSPITVGGSTSAEGFKIITIIVAWDDTGGPHEVRQDTGIFRHDDDD